MAFLVISDLFFIFASKIIKQYLINNQCFFKIYNKEEYTMNNLWNKFYENKIVNLLVHQPMRLISKVFSDGGFHFIFVFILAFFTYWWYDNNVKSSSVMMNDISLSFEECSSPAHFNDTLTYYHIYLTLDSEDLFKTTGKYKSRLSLSYAFDWYSEYTSAFLPPYEGPIDTVIINFYHRPTLSDLKIDQDSIIYPGNKDTLVYKTNISSSLLSDSSTEVKVIPTKENLNQHINFYSNELGLHDDSPYYNYSISLPFFNLASDTQNFKGGQSIIIQIGDLKIKNGFYHNVNKNITYQYIYPEPDIINNGFIYYKSEEKLQKVRDNHGIIIQATDLDALNRSNRKSIVNSVLVGTGVALIFDIIIQLFRELRNVNQRYDEKLTLNKPNKYPSRIQMNPVKRRRKPKRKSKKNSDIEQNLPTLNMDSPSTD